MCSADYAIIMCSAGYAIIMCSADCIAEYEVEDMFLGST